MLQTKKLLVTLLIVVLAVSAAATLIMTSQMGPPNQSGGYEEAIITARTEIWKDINSGKASSGTVAIMDNGKIVYSEGFGMADRENSVPVTPTTMFNIGSISKTFCAAAVMLLVDDGKVQLDENVTTYLPDFKMADQRYKDITVRMLLDHTSGLPGTVEANDFGYAYNPSFYSDVYTALSTAHLKAAPGSMGPYCNDGFTLAEMFVARVSGQNYTDFLSQRIFKPLSLGHTGLSVGMETGKAVATYYQADTGKKVPSEVLSLIGAGGLASTAEDLVRFADSLCTNGNHLLSATSVEEMTKLQASTFAAKAINQTGLNPEFAYGLGLDVVGLSAYQANGVYVIGKGGDTDDFHSMFLSAKEQRISVAIIEAGQGSSAHDMAFKVLNSVLQQKDLMPKQEVPVTEPPTPQTIPASYSSFNGFYSGGMTLYSVNVDLSSNVCALSIYKNGLIVRSGQLIYNDGVFYSASGNKFYLVSVDGQSLIMQPVFGGVIDYVIAQKVTPLDTPLSLDVDINGTYWLRRNVLPSEAMSFDSSHMVLASTFSDLPGFIDFSGIMQVKSGTYAGMPVGDIRDQYELNLVNKDGQVWVQLYDMLYSPASDAIQLKMGNNTATIGGDGYNQWFVLPQGAVLSFQMPAKDRVIVHASDGSAIYDSVVDTGDIYAPEGCYVEFAGLPGDQLTVTAR